jgi:TM2 domain-containing membrane protein YozV
MATPNEPGNPSGEPPWGGQPRGYGSHQNPQIPPPAGYPVQPGYPYPQSYPGTPSYPYPGYFSPGYAIDPQAPYGRDPATGAPLSDKSAVAAGCLQLFFGFLGIGRFYIGSNSIAGVQLALGLLGLFFGLFCLIGLPLLLGVVVWTLIDAIMIFTGSVPDNYGRKLR